MQDLNLTLTLSVEEINLILTVLSKQSIETSLVVFSKIKDQSESQIKEQQKSLQIAE